MTDIQRARIYTVLRKIGVQAGDSANIVIEALVDAVMENPGAVYGQFFTEIMPVAAAQAKRSTSSVSANMTRAIKHCWETRRQEMYDLFDFRDGDKRPTPKQFISRLVEMLQQ